MPEPASSGDSAAATERGEGEPTPAYLARVLTNEGAPEWMVTLAKEGHYDDFLSPLAMNLHQLRADALENGLPQVARWVEGGVFDSTKAESDAWARSPEGRATFQELLGSTKNRAQRRAEERRRRRKGNL